MNRYFSFRYRAWCYLLVVFGLIAGCALKTTVVPTAVSPQAIAVASTEGFQWPDNDLASRFQQYWTLRKAGDSAGSFEYEAPHVQEMVIRGRYDSFYNKARKDWESIRVEKINKISDQLFEVDFNMMAKTSEGAAREIFFRDSWLLFSNQWVHVLKDPFMTGDGIGK